MKNVNELKTTDECVYEILDKLYNFTASYYKEGLFSDPYKNTVVVEQLSNYRFKHNFTDIFSNLFSILSRLNMSREQFAKPKRSLLKFLEIEDELAWNHLEELSNFIRVKGDLLEPNELMELLTISVNAE